GLERGWLTRAVCAQPCAFAPLQLRRLGGSKVDRTRQCCPLSVHTAWSLHSDSSGCSLVPSSQVQAGVNRKTTFNITEPRKADSNDRASPWPTACSCIHFASTIELLTSKAKSLFG